MWLFLGGGGVGLHLWKFLELPCGDDGVRGAHFHRSGALVVKNDSSLDRVDSYRCGVKLKD